jgi:hypothetical protein
MSMGYLMTILDTPTVGLCPLCGENKRRVGLVVLQQPSGDAVCEGCLEQELPALHDELQVLRYDTPTDFPGVWPELARRLAAPPDTDAGLGRLLGAAALQRDPAWPVPVESIDA